MYYIDIYMMIRIESKCRPPIKYEEREAETNGDIQITLFSMDAEK